MELNSNLKEKTNENFRLPRWNEIPNIDLYIDQVVSYLENYLSNYIKNEKEKKPDKIITKTMINNYVKQKVMDAPIQKKYNRNSLAYLFVICILKQVYSINDIDKLIKTILKDTPIDIAYNGFCDTLEDAIYSTLINKKFVVDKSTCSENRYVLLNVVQTIASKLYVEKFYLEK